MTDVMDNNAFDPFQQIITRPIPKTYKNEKKEEKEDDDEQKEVEIIPKIPIVISLSSKVEVNREEILERLRKSKKWITRCDTPLKYTEDSDYEFDSDIYQKEKEEETSDEEEKEKEEVEEEEKEEVEVEVEEKEEEEVEEKEEEEIEEKEEVEEIIEETEQAVEEKIEIEESKKKGKKEPKEKKTKPNLKENIDLAKVKLGEWEAHLPKPEKRIIRTPFYLNNRKKFIQKLNDIFAKYRQEINNEDTNAISCKRLRDSTSGDFVPLMHQKVVKDYLNLYTPYRGILLYHGLGAGKCHKKNTPIIMFNGTIKMVQDINIGDLLMGDDSKPRKVLSLARGRDEMYDIIPVKGDKYTVNKEHILCLQASGFPKLCYNDNNINTNYNVQWIENNTYKSKTFTFSKSRKDQIQKKIDAEIFLKQIQEDPTKNNNILEVAVKDYLH